MEVSGEGSSGTKYRESGEGENVRHFVSGVHGSTVVQGKGNVTVGELTFNINADGQLVLINMQDASASPPKRRSGTIDSRVPKGFIPPERALLNRSRERASCRADQPGMIELLGEYGIGKSRLLLQLGYDLEDRYCPGRFRDGFAYIPAHDRSFDDLLYRIWDLFWEPGVAWTRMPSSSTMRLQLLDIDGLLLLEDPSLSEADLFSLSNAVQHCTVILTVENSVVGSFGNSVFVGDMDVDDLIAIARRQCQILQVQESLLTPDVLQGILAESRGNPQRCIRATSTVLVPQRYPPAGYGPAEEQVVSDTVQTFQHPVPDDVLRVITKLPNAGEIAADLAIRGELESHSPRFTYPWPKRIVSPADDRVRHLLLLEYLREQSLTDREDLQDLALELFEWLAGQPPGLEFDQFIRNVRPLAQRLAAALATRGYVDRWARLCTAVEGLGRSGNEAGLVAWADKNLGVIAMCRGDWGAARDRLKAAIAYYIRASDGKASAECDEFLQAAIVAVGGGPDESGDSSSIPDVGPVLPTTGAEAVVEQDFEPADAEVVRELVTS
ncbi:hypothetical protein OHB24_21415 [Kribbella sp. NBC_00482]|uniref:hypothetical protein n=1 Tax=Kribbella sp. NBC_00482 TaxID=2975968 RepID=UPI002E178260